MSTIVIGSGLSGIFIAKALSDEGEKVTLIGDELGGMQSTLDYKGDEFSPFGCFLFKDKEFIRALKLSGVELEKVKRNMKVEYKGKGDWRKGFNYKLIDYPFQSNLKQLPFKDRVPVMFSYIKSKINNDTNYVDFTTWAYDKFGEKLAEMMIIPHTKKKYGDYYFILDYKQFADKMSTPTGMDLFNEMFLNEDLDWDFDNYFYSPKKGMKDVTYNLLKGYGGKISFHQDKVEYILPRNKMLRLSGGLWKRYDKLISTIPINNIIDLVDTNLPPTNFDFISMMLYIFVLPKNSTPNIQAIYNPDEDVPWHRVLFPHNYVNNWDKDFEIATFEVCNPKMTSLDYAKIISYIYKNFNYEILDSHKRFIKSAYPVIKKNSKYSVYNLTDILAADNIYLFGRSARFDYTYLHDLYKDSVKFANFLTEG